MIDQMLHEIINPIKRYEYPEFLLIISLFAAGIALARIWGVRATASNVSFLLEVFLYFVFFAAWIDVYT